MIQKKDGTKMKYRNIRDNVAISKSVQKDRMKQLGKSAAIGAGVGGVAQATVFNVLGRKVGLKVSPAMTARAGIAGARDGAIVGYAVKKIHHSKENRAANKVAAQTGYSQMNRMKFESSNDLRNLRKRRKYSE